ncbi:MAG: DUF6884 domain-containing protein [Rhizobiaceae bacterium]
MLQTLDAARGTSNVRSPRWPWLRNDAIYVIPCSATKQRSTFPARELYQSKRFTQQLRFVNAIGGKAVIFSAKHGIVELDKKLEPYDLPLSTLNQSERERLKSLSVGTLSSLVGPRRERQIVVLGTSNGPEGVAYDELIRGAASEATANLVCISASKIGFLLGEASVLAKRKKYLEHFYAKEGPFCELKGPFSFTQIPNHDLPKSGVYFFTDESEVSAISEQRGRIVRIGTHGVANGSKATLAQRLRAHYGLGSGGGNHRSSIFRLHVGECLLRSGMFETDVETWQNELPRNEASYALEQQLEFCVSKYIRRLSLWFLAVSGPSHKNSRRALLEARAIRNLTGYGLILDGASTNWLGRHSTRKQIVESGLWNVQHVGSSPDAPSHQLQLF